jgi:hypothetical protein
MIEEKQHGMHLAVFFFCSLRIELAVRRVIHHSAKLHRDATRDPPGEYGLMGSGFVLTQRKPLLWFG